MMNGVLSDVLMNVPKDEVIFKKVVRETAQEIVLSGLSRGNFFKRAAFQGGTCLRLFHGLDRFSEDLDFCITDGNDDLDVGEYCGYIDDELASFGLEVRTEIRKERHNISGCIVKGNLRDALAVCGYPDSQLSSVEKNTLLRIKIDIDRDTPFGFKVEHTMKRAPFQYSVALLDMPSLFSGKISTVIGRQWHNRFKGRDLYDFNWYIDNGVRPNMAFLESNLKRAGLIGEGDRLTEEILKRLLKDRFSVIDYDDAAKDVLMFVNDAAAVSKWDEQYFNGLISRMVFE